MAYIKLSLDHPLVDGESVTFKAPCDCTAVTGLKVYYVDITDSTETETSKLFTFKDTHGNSLTNTGNLFTANAYVKVILDSTNGFAYIQNADTNAYLESKFAELEGKSDVFIATYGTTTSAEIEAAYQAGKAVFMTDSGSGNLCTLSGRNGATSHFFVGNRTDGDGLDLYTIRRDAWSYSSLYSSPATHAGTHKTGGTDPITPASIGAAPAYTYGTEDLTAGTSALETGKIYLMYE